jgi:CRISPR/Cas system endoribonuclease Cas6 (RAMP superfamily)
MAIRVLSALAVICAVAGIALFTLHAFSYVIALALAAVFAIGALAAMGMQRVRAPRV